jgi:hypothetical protein
MPGAACRCRASASHWRHAYQFHTDIVDLWTFSPVWRSAACISGQAPVSLVSLCGALQPVSMGRSPDTLLADTLLALQVALMRRRGRRAYGLRVGGIEGRIHEGAGSRRAAPVNHAQGRQRLPPTSNEVELEKGLRLVERASGFRPSASATVSAHSVMPSSPSPSPPTRATARTSSLPRPAPRRLMPQLGPPGVRTAGGTGAELHVCPCHHTQHVGVRCRVRLP